MSKTYIADKETLDAVKTDTDSIIENLSNYRTIKNVQTGEIKSGVNSTNYQDCGSSSGTTFYGYGVNIEISSVNVLKSVVEITGAGSANGISFNPVGFLVDETTLRIIFYSNGSTSGPSADGYTAPSYIRWQVVEYN